MSSVSPFATPFPTDQAARRAAAGLRWIEAGRSGTWAWGRCQGTAQQPYDVVVQLGGTGPADCTCPSRRRPCKHVLGLMLSWADDQLGERPEPDFARQGRERLATEAAAPRTAADPEVAAAAAAARVAARRERVEHGLEELQRWLTDQVRGGLAGLPRAGYGHVDAMAARLIDAQASGVAAMVRGLPSDLVGERWPERALHRLGGLHLLIQAHARLDELPADLAATVRSRVGYPMAKADVLDTRGVADTWWALGAVDTIDHQLESRRVWLRGARTGRWAVWLAFAPMGQALDTSVLPGLVLPADLHFYPGAGHRALVGQTYDWPPELLPTAAATEWTVTAARAEFAAALAADPWSSRMPALVHGVPVRPERPGDPWRLRDVEGRSCELVDLEGEPWPLLAQSAGRPLVVFGEWSGRGLSALSVLGDDDGRVFSTEISG